MRPLPSPSPPLLLLSSGSSTAAPWRGPGKIKQVVWAWQESWPGPGWAGLQAAGGYQKLLGPALGRRSEWPRASLSCEFWELPRGPSNTSELPIWRSLGNWGETQQQPHSPHSTPPTPLLSSASPPFQRCWSIKGEQGGEECPPSHPPATTSSISPPPPPPVRVLSWGGRTTQRSTGQPVLRDPG